MMGVRVEVDGRQANSVEGLAYPARQALGMTIPCRPWSMGTRRDPSSRSQTGERAESLRARMAYSDGLKVDRACRPDGYGSPQFA